MASLTAAGYAAWDPFTDASDALEGRTTVYVDSGNSVKLPLAGPDEDWDPFTDPEMLELAGELALESDDVEALESWVQQARAAKLPREKILPKDERLRELKWRREDMRKRRVVKEKLDAAMRGNDWAKLRETIGDAARAGVAHPTQLRAASQQLQSLKSAEADFFRRKDIVDTARREEENQAMAEVASEKLWRKALVPSLDVEVTDEERGALEWVLCKPRPTTMEVRLCFPAGDEDHVQVPYEANAAALLTALIPMKSKHRIPEDFALFTASGCMLLLDRPLQVQGVRSGGTVRIDDRERGSRAPEAAPEAEASCLQLAVWEPHRPQGPAVGRWTGNARLALNELAGHLQRGHGLLGGQASFLTRYTSLAQTQQSQHLPLAICDGPVAAEVVLEEEAADSSSAILEWMDEYIRQVVHGEAPRTGAATGTDALFEEWEQAVEAEAEARLDEEEITRYEVDDCWVHVYWPLSYTKPALSDFRAELRGHAQTVVLAWNAAADKEIMDLSLEVCDLARAGFFVATGEVPPAEGSLPSEPVKSSFLRLSSHAESRELGRTVHSFLREQGVGESRALVVVSRTFQSKRIALALDFFRGRQPWRTTSKDVAKTSLAIIPYCVGPQEAVLHDCMDRKLDILAEAQLLVELDARILNSEATEALMRLLEVFPMPSRQHWEAGMYRKPERGSEPFKELEKIGEEDVATEAEEDTEEEEEVEEEDIVEEAQEEVEEQGAGAQQIPAAPKAQEEDTARLAFPKRDRVEFMDSDDDAILFVLNSVGSLGYFVNSSQQLLDVTACRIDAERVIRLKGTPVAGSTIENWRVAVKIGNEAAAKSVEDLFLKRQALHSSKKG